MIINALLNLILLLLSGVFNALELDLPTWQVVVLNITEFIGYIAAGCRVVAAYTDFSYLLVLLGLSVLVSAFYNGYKLIRWILRKIPFINIS